MDYDDNDFQVHNLQLGGEGCSKVSPVLHSYALPKFDFDDSLQGHLRFDSLVENEVFLGITSQEDNQWIEEYSRGSSGIVFSSSAVESRRNNVWFEATSSESVEMLLKSVGQEDKVMGEPKIQQLDVSNEPGSVTKIVDPNLNEDEGKDLVTHPQNTSLPNAFSGDFHEQPHITSQSQEAQLSGGELNSVVIIEKNNSSVLEEVDTTFNDIIQKEAENFTGESKMPENDKSECDIIDSSMVSVDKLPDTGVGGSINLVGTKLTEAGLTDGALTKVLHEDLIADKNTSEVHTGGSNDEDRGLSAKNCDSVQVGCESRSSEVSAICVNQDIQALDYIKKVEPSISVEGFKENSQNTVVTSNSETDMSVRVEPVAGMESDKSSLPDTSDGSHLLSGSLASADTDDQPKSPIFGVSLVHQDNMEKVEGGLTFHNNSQNKILQVENLVASSSKNPSSLVEKEASTDQAEKVVDELDVHSSSEKGGNNAELGGQQDPKESMIVVNESNEHQTLSDVAGPSEYDANQIRQDVGSFSGLDKSQVVSHAHVSSNTTDDLEGDIPSVSSMKATQEKNFTFEVNKSAVVEQTGKGIQSYPTFQVSILPKITEGPPPSTDSSSQADTKKSLDSSVSSQNPSGTSKLEVKGKSERKPRRKSVGKESARKGNNVKEATPARDSARVEKSSMSLTPPATGQIVLHEAVKSNENVERGGTKPTGVFPLPKLPDLNNSTSTFRQPFTDNQQVQLRAQILVYGSLISGSPPEEPHMIAAFGQSEGGRAWEGVWRACLERLHVQKAQTNSTTPMQSRSDLKDAGNRVDQGIKHTSIQNKVTSSHIGVATNKTTPPIVSPMIPPSPFWNVSTPSDNLQSSVIPRTGHLDYPQAPSSLHAYQTPAVQNFSLHNPSWLSQGPFAGQWVTAFNTGPHFPALPINEAVKLTPVKESAGTSITHTSSPMVTVSYDQPSSDSKTRKRRKGTANATVKQISDHSPAQIASVSAPLLFHLPQTDSLTAPIVGSAFSTSVSVSTPAFITSKSSAHHHPRSGDQNLEKLVISQETLSKVEESKLQAEEAAACAAAAISHCHGVWSQLERQSNFGLNSDDEAKLVSSAASIAAAASVAKVAAAAAKIALNVAEEARLMVNVFPNSVIHDAMEATRQRVQAASASSKHAENLDAVVKAAELAAEAVSQAGKIVAMSEPLPLRHLVEAGPEGYWKTPAFIAGNLNGANQKNGEAASEVSDKGILTTKSGLSRKENSMDLTDVQTMEVDDILVPSTSREKDKKKPRVRKSHDLTKNIEIAQKSDHGSIDTSIIGQTEPKVTSSTLKDDNNDIKEGCLVEVYKNDDKYDGAWFGANVLSLSDGKALVCYTEIQSDEGPLKEWVPLEVKGTEVPKMRVAHPLTTMRFEGNRKRRRTPSTDLVWSSGDRVDVWIQDRWREGVVKETNKIDLTSLTVQFPAQGETSVVRSWFVRPALIWKDGKWVESHTSEKHLSSQGDAPQEKRLKLGSPIVESRRNDDGSSAKVVDLVDSKKQEESRTLPLSTHERLFSVGSTRDDKKPGAHNTIRSRLQKEGPGVIFGVPKPGKKQKFMDVSKHYVGDGSNRNNPAHDSVKFTRYLIPQAPGSRGWRTNLRSDAKEKQAAESKPRTLKPRKPPIPSAGRTIRKTAQDSVGDDENQSVHQSSMDFGLSSNIDDAPKHADVASSGIPPEPSKGVSILTTKSERLNKRKFTPVSGKLVNVEKSHPEPVEQPRRSNRKIQPTSRLLEGLQSSMTISKMPSASHTAPRKVTLKGNTDN